MRHPLRVITALLFMIAGSMISLHAQTADNHVSDNEPAVADNSSTPTIPGAPYVLHKGDNEFGFWGGVAFQATTIFGGLHADEASGRRFVIAALRYGRTLAATKNYALQYTLDAVPVAVATGNIVQSTTVTTSAGTVTTFRRESTYGAGLTPLGLQLDFRNSSHIKPFIHVNGGALIFTKPVPLPDAGKFAFVGEAGTGVRIFTSARRAVTLGLMFHHISNGNRSGANRGLNEFVINAGFSVFK
ncbi:MAG: hypothetical protein QOC96_2270 [Acidobacteriota bacterium]|nr:hypothetical protein [Acidobacteriota bacterium]